MEANAFRGRASTVRVRGGLRVEVRIDERTLDRYVLLTCASFFAPISDFAPTHGEYDPSHNAVRTSGALDIVDQQIEGRDTIRKSRKYSRNYHGP